MRPPIARKATRPSTTAIQSTWSNWIGIPEEVPLLALLMWSSCAGKLLNIGCWSPKSTRVLRTPPNWFAVLYLAAGSLDKTLSKMDSNVGEICSFRLRGNGGAWV